MFFFFFVLFVWWIPLASTVLYTLNTCYIDLFCFDAVSRNMPTKKVLFVVKFVKFGIKVLLFCRLFCFVQAIRHMFDMLPLMSFYTEGDALISDACSPVSHTYS